MDVLVITINEYINVFNGYFDRFFEWGNWLFYTLLTINIVWLCLWYAFDKNSFVASTSSFIKQFFVIALFYAIMSNHQWLLTLLQTAGFMGKALVGIPLDPAAIIANGIVIANKILAPAQQASLTSMGLGMLIIFTTWCVVTFTFVSIAIYLSLTLIITTALITMAAFFLSFIALGVTSKIAHKTLDVVMANCVKLLGIYIVVGIGAKTVSSIGNLVPAKVVSFDIYTWIMAICILFWLLAKHLPQQLAQVVTNFMQDMRSESSVNNIETTSLAVAAVGDVRGSSLSARKIVADGAAGLAKIAGNLSVRSLAAPFENSAAPHAISPQRTVETNSAINSAKAASIAVGVGDSSNNNSGDNRASNVNNATNRRGGIPQQSTEIIRRAIKSTGRSNL